MTDQQPSPHKVDAAKIRILTLLKENGPTAKTQLINTVRHYSTGERAAAFEDVLKNKYAFSKEKPSIKQGPNPVVIEITKMGELELEELRAKYNK